MIYLNDIYTRENDKFKLDKPISTHKQRNTGIHINRIWRITGQYLEMEVNKENIVISSNKEQTAHEIIIINVDIVKYNSNGVYTISISYSPVFYIGPTGLPLIILNPLNNLTLVTSYRKHE